MLDYRLYHLTGGHISRAEAFQADDDVVAVREGRTRLNGKSGELWSNDRFVAALDAVSAERHSGEVA